MEESSPISPFKAPQKSLQDFIRLAKSTDTPRNHTGSFTQWWNQLKSTCEQGGQNLARAQALESFHVPKTPQDALRNIPFDNLDHIQDRGDLCIIALMRPAIYQSLRDYVEHDPQNDSVLKNAVCCLLDHHDRVFKESDDVDQSYFLTSEVLVFQLIYNPSLDVHRRYQQFIDDIVSGKPDPMMQLLALGMGVIAILAIGTAILTMPQLALTPLAVNYGSQVLLLSISCLLVAMGLLATAIFAAATGFRKGESWRLSRIRRCVDCPPVTSFEADITGSDRRTSIEMAPLFPPADDQCNSPYMNPYQDHNY